jgi:hypothetical protein
MKMDYQKFAKDLRFDLLRNAIYHSSRSNFLDMCNRIFVFLAIMFGTTAAADLGSSRLHLSPAFLSTAAAISATISLVGNFAVAARTHSYLQRRCYEMLSEVERLGEISESSLPKLSDIRGQLTTIYGEEPPPMRALDAIAYNAACDSLFDGKGRLLVSGWQSVFRHFYPYNGTDFPHAPALR